MAGKSGILTAIPWYKRDEYQQILALMVDADELPRTYDAWLAKAKAAEHVIRRRGDRPRRVHTEPRQFTEWCLSRGLDFDKQARGLYVSTLLPLLLPHEFSKDAA